MLRLDMSKAEYSTDSVIKLIKVVRKLHKVGQVEMASILGVNQSSVSKIESGHAVLSLEGYTQFCLKFNIPLNAHLLDYIDDMKFTDSSACMNLNHSFKIDSRYCIFSSIAVREVRPLIEYSKHQFGETYLNKKLEEKKVDPLYFYKMDNVINPLFLVDFTNEIIKEKGIKLHDIFSSKYFYSPSVHGNVYENLSSSNSAIEALEKYVNVSPLYDCNYNRELKKVNKKTAKLIMTPKPKYLEFTQKWEDDKKDLIDKYYYEFTKKICSFGHKKDFHLSLNSNKDGKCTYLLDT